MREYTKDDTLILVSSILVAAVLSGWIGFTVGKNQGLALRVPAFQYGYLSGYCQATYAVVGRIPQDERLGLGITTFFSEVGRGLGPEMAGLAPTLPYRGQSGPWEPPGGDWNPASGEINHGTIGEYLCWRTVPLHKASDWRFDQLEWGS